MAHYSLLTLLVVLWSLNPAANEVYYITTTPIDRSCPGPCLTLFQFARNISRLLYPNTTLIFLPGTHSLNNTVLTISNVDNFAMRPGNSTAHIVCQTYSSNIYFNHSHNIEITNLEFIGCGGNQVKHVVEFVVQDTKFIGQENSGTALELIDTTAQIVNGTFVSNRRGLHRKCVLHDPDDGCVDGFIGGAIIATNSTIDINQSKFKDNGADFGGAIFAEHNSIIIVSGDAFFENQVTILGGVLYSNSSSITIEASEFYVNGAIHWGAVLLSFNCIITIKDSNFQNNTIYYGRGGVLHFYLSVITIEVSKFYKNNPTWWGGVLHSDYSTIMIEDSEFCNTYDGRGLDSSNSNITIGGTKFKGQEHSGSAIELAKTRAEIINSTFVSNRGSCDLYDPNYGCYGRSYGGAILATDNTVIDISLSTFEYNTADFGGAIYAQQHSIINMNRNVFSHNTATQVGGGAVLCSHSSNITVETSKFFDNSASLGGGAMTYDSIVIFEASKFHYNSADIGGVVYSINSSIIIRASEFHDNRVNGSGGVLASAKSAIKIETSTFYDNNAATGGVLETIDFVDTAGHNGSTMGPFLSSAIIIEASEFHDNTAILHGGVMQSSNTTISISNSNFTENCSPRGALIFAIDGSKIYYKNLLIDNNSANEYGVLYILDSEFQEYPDSENFAFSNNLGSLVAFNSNITFVSYAIFVNNHPQKTINTSDDFHGGAITLYHSNIFFNGECILECNHAENGGAIYSIESKLYVNGNVTIKHNKVSRSGGGVYLSTSELNCQHKSGFILFGNTAAEKGGGMHAISSSIKATSAFTWPQYTGARMNFTNNSAKRGGGLSLEANAKLYILKNDK